MGELIPHSRPSLGPQEAAEVQRVVLSGLIAQGAEVEQLEQEIGIGLRVPYVSAVAHGTGALHLALLGMGAMAGKEVILPSYSCASLLNAVVYTGATPVLVDCLTQVPDIDLGEVSARMSEKTAAVIVPHLFGRVVDLSAFVRPGLLLEDGTHSLGADCVGQVGAACAYSFYATKMLAGGEGGAVTTATKKIHATVQDSRSYDQRPHWKLRFNYKMTDLSAAMLRVQFTQLAVFLQRRRALAAFYRQALDKVDGVVLPPVQKGEVCYRFVVRLPGRSLERVQRALLELGVSSARPVWRTLHQCLKLSARSFPNSQRWWRETLSIPIYPALSDLQAERVAECLRIATLRN